MKLKFVILLVLVLVATLAYTLANASGGHDDGDTIIIINPPPDDNGGGAGVNTTSTDTVNTFSVTSGVSDHDLQSGLAAAMAGGGHQFDFSTTDWQLSVTAVWEVSDEEETGYSFGAGKRWKEQSYVPDALFHMSYTPNGSQDYFMVGGTFRIK